MNNIESRFIPATEIVQKHAGKNEKFADRFTSLLTNMEKFVEAAECGDRAFVNASVLGYALVDYFEDIERLKSFHRIEHINSIKVISYTSYWLIQRKPIQVKGADDKLMYINERFVLAYILESLSENGYGDLLLRHEPEIEAFKESLLYYLKYRVANATSLEMTLLAFFAGRSYQSPGVNLEKAVAKYSSE